MKIGGGVSTVRQYLQAGLVDELHFAIAPVVLGRGEAMFAGLDLTALGFRAVEHVTTPAATTCGAPGRPPPGSPTPPTTPHPGADAGPTRRMRAGR